MVCWCRYDEAVLDLEAAQHMYFALGQQAKGNALKDDVAKIKQLQATVQTTHAQVAPLLSA